MNFLPSFAFRKQGRVISPVIIVLIFVLSGLPSLHARKAMDLHPVQLTARDDAHMTETDQHRILVFNDGVEIRQGSRRITAPAAVIWINKGADTGHNYETELQIYAQGKGTAGKPAEDPVYEITDDRKHHTSTLYRRITTKAGISWNVSMNQVDNTEQLGGLYATAEETVKGEGQQDFERETLPEKEPHEEQPPLHQALQADEIHFFSDEEDVTTAVYMGNVRGTYQNVRFNSETAVIWFNEATGNYELYARGNVKLERDGEGPDIAAGDILSEMGELSRFRADQIYVNTGEERARASGAEIRMVPAKTGEMVVMRGKELYTLDASNLVLEQVSATHCNFGDPHYHLMSRRARVIRQDPHLFVSFWQPGIEVGPEDRTLLQVPFLSEDFGEQSGFILRSVALGTSGRFGSFIRTRWRPSHLGLRADWLDAWDARLDYFSKRGPGIGSTANYSFEGPGDSSNRGFLTGYYVHDEASRDDTGLPVPQRNRGRLWWQHRVRWNENWRTDAELHWLSDHGFLHEYYESEFNNERPPESYIYTRYRNEQAWGSFTVKERVNDFMNQVEESPSIRLEGIGLPTGPFVYDATFDAGVYDLETSDRLTVNDPSRLSRFHTDHRLSLPFSIGNLRVDPYVRTLATWASEGSRNNGANSEQRIGGGGGTRISMDLHRTYNVDNETLDLNRLRHIMTPYVDARRLETNTDSDEFIQLGGMDPWPRYGNGARPYTDSVDGIDDSSRVRAGMRQRFQTKRRSGSEEVWEETDWIDLDVAFVGRSDDSVRLRDDDNYVDLDFLWNIFDWLKLISEDNRISLQDGRNVWNAVASMELSSRTEMGVGYHYVSDETESVDAHFRTALSDRYSIGIWEEYEFNSQRDGDNTNFLTKVALNRHFHKWIGSLSVTYDGRQDGETEVMITFYPAGAGAFLPGE